MSQRNIQVQHQVQEQVQVQTLSPQQVMLARLTEMSVEALEQRVEKECLENPWLENADAADNEEMVAQNTAEEDTKGDEYADAYSNQQTEDGAYDYRTEDDIPDYMLRTNNGSKEPENMEYGDSLSFYDQLKAQMGDFDLTEHEEQLMEYLIGSLDDDGILRKSLHLIADEAEIYQGLETNSRELERLLGILQQFDPAGIGARNLQECLLIQVDRDRRNPHHDQLKTLLEKYYEDFTHNRWKRIGTRMLLSETEAEELRHEVRRLNPRPGSSMGEKIISPTDHITPDFIVETDQYDNISMTLNQGNVPTLIISPDAKEKIERYEKKRDVQLSKAVQEDLQFTRRYVETGQLFINALIQRRESMTKTMQAIIRLQRDFFLEGDVTTLKPMILEDVARVAGYDISTVSRVCNNKYVQTTFGTFPLKWFFRQGTIQKADQEDAVTAHQVMAVMKEIIEAEDKRHPLSDEKLTVLMKEKGYNIARRTIAKYRELMGIPVARLRR